MTSASLTTPPAIRALLRFLRTPKGLCLIIFAGLVAISAFTVGVDIVLSRVIVAVVTAAAIDVVVTYVRRGRWILPDGAALTGMIVAFILRPQESWLILIVTVSVAILSKHALRTHWSNILNPAAFALVVVAIAVNTGQSWWGALPDLGMIGALVLLVAGALMADRMNKLPMILAFFATYFTLFAVASISRSAIVAETFLTPDLQAALFFAFFMLDDPPTSPVRHEDQVVFGIIVAAVAYFIFMQFGAVYFLPAGLLVGNVWESGRRLVFSRVRLRETPVLRAYDARWLRVAGAVGAAAVAAPLVMAVGIFATGASSTPGTSTPYPFEPSFQSDFKGTYSQANDATSGHLVLDGLATGDLSLGVHVEVLQVAVVPPSDDESLEDAPDDEESEAQPMVQTTVNTAQLLDPASNGLLCDGALTTLSRGTMRFGCDGTAAYVGVQMQIEGQLNASPDGTFDGALSGIMQRTD